MKIVTADQMRMLEHETEERGTSMDQLMENAGLAVARTARQMLGPSPKGEHVTVLVGPGNNGGDGLVAARHLNDWGARAHVVLCAPRKSEDPKLELLRDFAVDVVQLTDDGDEGHLDRALASSNLVIDAVLGTGKSRPITGTVRSALEQLRSSRKRRPGLPVLALDIPTGLDADTGAIDSATPAADVTVTLGFPKVGLFIFPGAGKVGRLEVAGIGIPDDLPDAIGMELSSGPWVGSILPPRPLNANKGTFGKLMVVAGSARYLGAAYLACAGAIRAGAGLVTLATPRSLVATVAQMLPEVTFVPLDEADWGVVRGVEAARQVHQELPSYSALLVGCGLGQAPQTGAMVEALLLGIPPSLTPRVVVDADGLNLLSRMENWWQRIETDTVLTPHPGEMRRMTGRTVEDIQNNRLGVTQEAAAAWRKTVLLKGAHSIVANPEKKVRINPFVDPGLATAGTGDVLAGITAGLLAQGMPTFHGASAAAYIHGAAGARVTSEMGNTGVAASDLLGEIPYAIRDLRAAV